MNSFAFDHLLVARVLFTLTTAGWAVGTVIADFNKTHATNPKWTGHARFHVVWQINSYVGFGLLACALIWWPGSDGAWLVVTLLAITQVGHVETLKRTAARVVGTVIGAVAAAGLVTIISNGAVLIGVGLILVVAAVVIRMGPHYWLYMAFITPAVVLFSSTSVADVPSTDAKRLTLTLIGAALVLLASGITLLWARYQQTHGGDSAAPA